MSAYYLNKHGITTTIIDEGNIKDNTSFVNAGLFSPFEKYPLSYPGIISLTAKLVLQGKSPFSLKPSLNPTIYKWLYLFAKNANHERLNKTLSIFEKYGNISKDLYHKMIEEDKFDFYFHDDGMILAFSNQQSFENRIANDKNKDEVNYEILDNSAMKKYMPFINESVIGGLLLKRDGYMDAGRLMECLKTHLKQNGVKFILNERIKDFVFENKKIKEIIGENQNYKADSFILATGADQFLAKKTGKSLMMVPAQGYSVTFEMPQDLKPKMASIFFDLFIAITPRQDTTRLTGRLILNSHDKNINPKYINKILQTLKSCSIPFELKNQKHLTGFRPLTPNDMPLIGRDKDCQNLIYATGLGWLGMSFAPAIGNIISDLIVNNKTNKQSEDILLFSGLC